MKKIWNEQKWTYKWNWNEDYEADWSVYLATERRSCSSLRPYRSPVLFHCWFSWFFSFNLYIQMARTKQTSRKYTGTLQKHVVTPDKEAGVNSDGISSTSSLADAVTQTGEWSSSLGDVISDLLLLKNNLLDCLKNINAVVNHVSRQVRCPRPASSGLDSRCPMRSHFSLDLILPSRTS